MVKNLCLFSSYFLEEDIPLYVRVYLAEISNFFDEVWLLTNDDQLLSRDSMAFLEKHRIGLKLVKNEGYDFGMWYKQLQLLDLSVYSEIALVNDSCLIIKPLDTFFEWARQQKSTFLGMVESNEVQRHIQSYFLLFRHEAIMLLNEYFIQVGIVNDYQEVVEKYELGLYSFLLKNGIRGKAMFPLKLFNFMQLNPLFFNYDQLLERGIPIVKKKMLFHALSSGEESHLKSKGYQHTSASLYQQIQHHMVNKHWAAQFETIYKAFLSHEKKGE